MPRVGVDFSVTAGKFQGSRSYLLGLYEAAIILCPNIDFYFYTPDPSSIADWVPAQYDNVYVRQIETGGGAYARLLIWLPRVIKRDDIDVIHTQYMLPFSRRAKRITTIHDVLFEDFPAYFPFKFRLRSRVLIRISAKLADTVLTVSNYCAARIAYHYGIPANRLAITANGTDVMRFTGKHGDENFYASLGIAGPGYILSVGRLEVRKNVSALVRAVRLLPEPRPQLVIVGKRDEEFHDPGLDFSWARPGAIVHLETVSDRDLPALYAGAGLFAYPSLAEGYGMPLMEAMASGVPVVCSNATAIPEVAGDAALIVDPADTTAFAEALRQVLEDDALSQRLRLAGRERVRSYTWSASARVLKDVIDRLVT
jgi:glycosyltransferase involved in cell wall biosynthesis